MLEEKFKLSGKLEIFRNGVLEKAVDNLVVTAGKQFVATRMAGTGAAVMSHMALGTGSTAAVVGNTTLGTEVGRVALTSTNVAGADVVYSATFPAGTATGTITEAGLFNDGTTGTMLCRTVFSAVAKGASDSITIVWTVTVS